MKSDKVWLSSLSKGYREGVLSGVTSLNGFQLGDNVRRCDQKHSKIVARIVAFVDPKTTTMKTPGAIMRVFDRKDGRLWMEHLQYLVREL